VRLYRVPPGLVALPLVLRLNGMRRDLPPSGYRVEAPRLVVFEVINLKPLKGEFPWNR
jgi:hypothetical protein